ncbi:unnamed protein product [Rotaria sordida]|uniref:Uncharacterized protein n=2 Tax=Rotaria sordida TaxID=392033 RepID=A0A814L7W4_9BILA|nr:unnamed protein product [Rotaria sordida]
MNLSRVQTSDETNRRHNNNYTNGTSTKKDSNLNNSIQTDHNIYAKVKLQLDMLDCNYEHDKREYYAQLIRDFQKTIPINELDKALKNQAIQYEELINTQEQKHPIIYNLRKCINEFQQMNEAFYNSLSATQVDFQKTIPINELDKALKNQEIQYEELINTQGQKRPIIHDLRKRINEFHQMNEAFYNSLSATQVYELKTDEVDHWQQRSLFTEKQSKLKKNLHELEQMKTSIENEIPKQSIELRDTIDKLFVDIVCARKKHQLLHNALLNVKFKSIDAEKLYAMHQNEAEHENEDLLTLDEKKKKFDEYKQILDKQMKTSIENEICELQRRSFQPKQEAKQSIELCDTIDKLFVDLVCARKKHQLLHNALLNVKFKSIDAEKLYAMHQNEEEHENEELLILDKKKKKFDEFKQILDQQRSKPIGSVATIILINPNIIHHRISLLIDALKFAANHFVKANLSFDAPSTFALSIYSLLYLLYLLYPNNLRRELQPESIQSINSNEKPTNRLGVLNEFYCIVCGTSDSEKQANRWQNESWQQLIANGDRYVVSDDISPLLSNDFKKRTEDEIKKSTDPRRFEIGQIIRLCNEYAESVLHPSEINSQIVKNTIKKQYGKKHSTDCYSNYSDSYCQTYDQQWQTTIQNGQMNLSRVQTSDETNRHHNNNYTNGTSTKRIQI